MTQREDDQHTLSPGKRGNTAIHKGNSYSLSLTSNEMAHTQNELNAHGKKVMKC